MLENVQFSFFTCFKYLGHMISYDLTDHRDIQKEIRNMFVRIFFLENSINAHYRSRKSYLNLTAFACMMLHCGHVIL